MNSSESGRARRVATPIESARRSERCLHVKGIGTAAQTNAEFSVSPWLCGKNPAAAVRASVAAIDICTVQRHLRVHTACTPACRSQVVRP
jgi:hypothetical protein